ncbi:MAG: response regulator [Deltaproteobacteria bacterium]|nr:response regulator [Deltaproteobacteria bacterium]
MYDFKKYLILVVDDEKRALNSFKYSFEDDFNIIFAQSATDAEKILNDRASEISVILSDHKMPNGLSGLDFLKKCATTHPDIVKILTTAYSNHDLAIDAVNS